MKEKKVSGLWDPRQPNDEITGIIINIQEEGGKYNTRVYTLETEDAIFDVFGSTVLNGKLIGIGNIGNKVKIVFLGKKQGADAEYKDFNVYLIKD